VIEELFPEKSIGRACHLSRDAHAALALKPSRALSNVASTSNFLCHPIGYQSRFRIGETSSALFCAIQNAIPSCMAGLRLNSAVRKRRARSADAKPG